MRTHAPEERKNNIENKHAFSNIKVVNCICLLHSPIWLLEKKCYPLVQSLSNKQI